MPIYDDILATIGKTPIVRINKISDEKCAKIFGKLEMFVLGTLSQPNAKQFDFGLTIIDMLLLFELRFF